MILNTSARENVPPPQTEGSKNYNGIDLIKFLCSILVFCIHIPFFPDESTYLRRLINFFLRHSVARLAVPFYFTCSGFFLFRKMRLSAPDFERIKGYCCRVLRLYAIWTILLVAGEDAHLWYLSATVIATVFLALLLRSRVKMRGLWLIAASLYTIGLLGDSYSVIAAPLADCRVLKLLFDGYKYLFATTRNGIFMGFPFVLMGAAFAQSKVSLSPKKSLLGLICSAFLLLVETFTLRHYEIPAGNMYILLLPSVYFLFSFAVQWELPDSPIFRRLRSAGLLFYFIHMLVDTLVQNAAGALETYTGLQLLPYRFPLSLTVTVILSFGIEALSRRDKFKWINWLIH